MSPTPAAWPLSCNSQFPLPHDPATKEVTSDPAGAPWTLLLRTMSILFGQCPFHVVFDILNSTPERSEGYGLLWG